MSIAYRVTELSPPLSQTDIPLPDAFSHQFFALRGSVITRGFAPELYSFDAAHPSMTELPLWIVAGDVERAQQSSMDLGLGYDLSGVDESSVLQTSMPLRDRWQRITEDDARLPIELDAHSVRWDLRVTKPGLYTVAGYIFSPPFNGWEVRPGLFKVVDGEDIPAAVVERVQETLFDGQGRRVSLCLDAERGTRLQLFLRLEDDPGASWTAWGGEEPVESGLLERCVTSPAPGLTGAARIRADLIGPRAQVHSFYSPDTITLLGSASACTASATICCTSAPDAAEHTDGGRADDVPDEAGSSERTVDAAQGGAPSPGRAGRSDSGCAVTSPLRSAEPTTRVAWMVLILLLVRGSRPRPTPRATGGRRRRCSFRSASRLPSRGIEARGMQVSILMVRALLGAVERAGGSRAEFLSAAGLEAPLIEDRNARLPVLQYLRVIDAALAVSGDPALGIHLGEQSSAVMFDVLGPLAERAATLREMVETTSRYARLVADGHDPQLVEAGDVASIRFPSLRGELAAARLTAEFALVALVRALGQYVPEGLPSMKVCFAYETPSYVSEYQRVFKGTEHFGHPFTGVEFPREWLERSQFHQSPDLFALLKTQAEQNLGRLERVATLSDRIKLALASRSPRELPTIDAMARELDMSARSLRRRLLAEGKTFGTLVERSRIHAAKGMLAQPRASIQDVAYAMGFAAPAAFHRAFKRWTGMTPKEYQDSL